MYIYASLYGEIRRFRAISWIEWLKTWQETGMMPNDLDRYSKHFGFLELSDMASWGPGDVNMAMEAITSRKRKRKTG